MKNQSESEEEKMNLLVKKLKIFLLGNFFLILGLIFVPPSYLPSPISSSFFFLFNVYRSINKFQITLIGNHMPKTKTRRTR